MNVTPLFVDKLALTWDCSGERPDGIRDLINHVSDDSELHIRYDHRGRISTDYNYNWRVAIPEAGATAVVSVSPLFPDMAPFRIEWNPARLEAYQADALWDFLSQITLDAFDEFLQEAVVTRIDLTVDIRPMRPTQLLFYVSRLQKEQVNFKGRELVSILHGDGGSMLSVSVYLKQKGGMRNGHRVRSTTRIEARLKPRCTLHELPQIESPFRRLHIYGNMPCEALEPTTPQTFRSNFALAQADGLQRVMQTITRSDSRARFFNWLNNNLETDWYNREEIWCGFPSAIECLRMPI